MQCPESFSQQTYKTSKGYWKYLPIHEKLPLPMQGVITFNKGDLVVGNSTSVQYRFQQKIGLIHDVGWSLNNFKHEADSTLYFPVALVIWDNGESTITSHGCLERVGKQNEN